MRNSLSRCFVIESTGVIFYIECPCGGKPISKQIEEQADLYAFLVRVLGLPAM